MAYLVTNSAETVFQTRTHYFSPRPSGPRLAESPVGRMVVASAPWAECSELIANLGAIKVAAYVLVGVDYPEGVITRCYVGETCDVVSRLRRHVSDPEKAFVREAYVIGSLDPAYDKLDVQLLQYRLNEEIERVDRAYIVRGVRPSLPTADAHRTRQAERDFEDVRRLLPSLGCNVLEARIASKVHANAADAESQNPQRSFAREGRGDREAEPRDRIAKFQAPQRAREAARPRHDQRPPLFALTHAGFVAYGYQHGGEFVVLPGSQMRREQMRSFEDDIANQQRRRDIIDAQVVARVKGHDDRWQLTRERRFPSRSIAAKVLMGVNLRTDAWAPVSAEPAQN